MTRGGAAGLLLATLLTSACATVRDDAALTQQADTEATTLLARVPAYADPALAARLAEIATRLAPLASVKLEILLDPALAAFALPDGRIFLTTGLVAAVENEAQLATILSREIVHVMLRHTPGAPPATPLAETELTRTPRVILNRRLTLIAAAAFTGYSAAADRDTDALALVRLVRAGYDPRQAPVAFAPLAADAGARGASEVFRLGDGAWLAARHESMAALIDPRTAAPTRFGGGWERLVAPLVRDNAAEDMRLGRFALARLQLARVFAAAPDDGLAYVYAGDLHRLQSQRARSAAERDAEVRSAQTAYTLAIVRMPALAEAHRQLGLLYHEMGDRARAVAELEQYLALAPDAADAARIRAYAADLAR